MKNIFLEANTIYLRPFEEGDEAFFTKWYNDPATRANIAAPLPTIFRQAQEYVQRHGKEEVWFAIVRKEDDKVLGETGLLRMFYAWRTTDLTIMIPEKEDQGKGYGSEAIQLMLDYAFGDLGFHRIAIGVVGFNDKALKFYDKAGFKKEGLQEDGYYYHHQYHDFIMMRILEDEFRKKSK